MGLTATYVDADTFTVVGDKTADFVVNRKVRCDCGGDGYKYCVVSASAFGDPNTTVDLTADSDDITANLTAVDWSVVKPGTAGNIPLLHHRDEDTGGLDFGWPTKPCNSKGNSFATLQAAIDDLAGDGWVFVSTGTWSEALVIDENKVTLFGTGPASIIDGDTTGHAINVNGDDCCIRDLQCKTTPAGGNTYHGVYATGARVYITRVYASQSDASGIWVAGIDAVIASCRVATTDGGAIVPASNALVCHNIIRNAGGAGVTGAVAGDDTVIVGNYINTTGGDGIVINVDQENCIVDGNRVTNWTGEAIDDDSGTSVIGDNDLT